MTNATQNHDDDLRQAYGVYSADHDQQREALMYRIAQEKIEISNANHPRDQRFNRLRVIASIAAVFLLAITVLLLTVIPQSQVYGIEGLASRLIDVQSLYMSGTHYFDIIDENGNEVRKAYPYKRYLERPGRYCANFFALEYPSGNAPTKVQESLRWMEDGVQGSKDLVSGQIHLSKVDPRLGELQIAYRFQSQTLIKVLSSNQKDFVKVQSLKKDGVDVDVYQRDTKSTFDESHDVMQVWLDRSTGLPTSVRNLEVDPQGNEKEELVIDKIEVNRREDAGMFPSVDGVAIEPASDKFSSLQSAGAGNSSLGIWYALQLNDHRIFACWMTNQTDLTKTEVAPKFIATLGDRHIPIPASSVQAFGVEGDQWTWSLLKLPEDLDINKASFSLQQTIEGSSTSLNLIPLKFAPERLEVVLKNVQELTMGATDLPALTLDQVLKY